METLNEILKIDFNLIKDFPLQSRLIENNAETEKILRQNANILKSINEKLKPTVDRPEISQDTLAITIKKLEADTKHRTQSWETRELRILSYYLSNLIKKEDVFLHAIKLLDENWKDIFFGGLLYFIMNTWYSAEVSLRNTTIECLQRHLKEYDGPIKKYQSIKEHSDYLDPAGPTRLAALILAKNLSIMDAPTLMGLKQSSFSQQYYSDVIINFLKKKPNIDIKDLETIFKNHTSNRTIKLVFADLIANADKQANPIRQECVAKAANSVMGNISLSSTWASFTGATHDEIQLLNHAHNLVVAWYARRSVESFFDVCVQDPRRRNFWLNYIEYITDFRIVGSDTTRSLLQNDERVSAMLKTYFIETKSRLSSTAALIIFIENKVFIEFSDRGAVYIYNSSHRIVNNIKNTQSISGTQNLKSTEMGAAVEQSTFGWGGIKSYSFSSEGKITHRGDWETRLNKWFINEMNIIVSVDAPFRKHISQSKSVSSLSSVYDEEDKQPIQQSHIHVASDVGKDNSKQSFKTTDNNDNTTDRVEPHHKDKTQLNQSEFKSLSSTQDYAENRHMDNLSHTIFMSDKEIPDNVSHRIRENKQANIITSRLLYNASCRLVAKEGKLYLNIIKGGSYQYLCDLKLNDLFGFSIRLERTEYGNQYKVFLAKENRMLAIGYIVKDTTDILFTSNEGQSINIILE